MFRLMVGVILFSFYANTTLAETAVPGTVAQCSIKLGGGGKDSPWLRLKNGEVTRFNDIGGPWSFIRKTAGTCDFALFNKHNFEGRRANYGRGINIRLRVGAKGGRDKNGWKARSLIMTPRKPYCAIELAENEPAKLSGGSTYRRQTFYGPAEHRNITGWSGIEKVTGWNGKQKAVKGCKYSLYSGVDFSGRSHEVTTLAHRTKLDWRVRSIKIKAYRLPAPTYKEIKYIKGRCLDVAGGVNKDGTNVQIYQCNNSKSQQWYWGDNGEIKNAMGRCLDITDMSVTSGSNIEIHKCNGDKAQKWGKARVHKIKNSLGFCLDLANGLDANGTNVQIYRCKNVDAQQWQY